MTPAHYEQVHVVYLPAYGFLMARLAPHEGPDEGTHLGHTLRRHRSTGDSI